ncbi:MAG: hypothetical protein R3316_03050 [Rhodovibrionaceae bacterium]|nr:hypothetical protein [Rhodovibrionaceae bacterium]
MRLVIERAEFRQLSEAAQKELLELYAGRPLQQGSVDRPLRARWRVPIDLTPDLCTRLMHGLSERHRSRLRLFAKGDGRARMSDLLAMTGDNEARALSHFEGAVTRRLRRILGDEEKKVHLIGWDYETTRWNEDQSEIVDGEYYVTPRTTEVLKEYFQHS